MYARRSGDRVLTFDFLAGLMKNNLLVVDRESHSVWSQLAGRAISGPLQGQPLHVLPSLQTTWVHWHHRHPNTRVLVVPGTTGHPYFYRNWWSHSPRSGWPAGRHDASALGLGLVLSGQAMFFPLHELDHATTPLRMELGGRAVTVHYGKEALTAWVEDAGGRLLPGVLAYQPSWMGFQPDTTVFEAQ